MRERGGGRQQLVMFNLIHNYEYNLFQFNFCALLEISRIHLGLSKTYQLRIMYTYMSYMYTNIFKCVIKLSECFDGGQWSAQSPARVAIKLSHPRDGLEAFNSTKGGRMLSA